MGWSDNGIMKNRFPVNSPAIGGADGGVSMVSTILDILSELIAFSENSLLHLSISTSMYGLIG